MLHSLTYQGSPKPCHSVCQSLLVYWKKANEAFKGIVRKKNNLPHKTSNKGFVLSPSQTHYVFVCLCFVIIRLFCSSVSHYLYKLCFKGLFATQASNILTIISFFHVLRSNFRHTLWSPLMTWLFVLTYQKQISAQQILSLGSQRVIPLKLLLNSVGLLRKEKKVLESIKMSNRLHTEGNSLWCSYLSRGTCKTRSFFMLLKYLTLMLDYQSLKATEFSHVIY